MPLISAGGGRRSGVQEHLHLYSKLNMERQTGLQETQSQKNVLNLKKEKKRQTIPRQFNNILNLQIDLYTKLCYKDHSQANNRLTISMEKRTEHTYVTGQTFVLLFLDLGLYFLADLCFCFGSVRTYSGSRFWFILVPHGK